MVPVMEDLFVLKQRTRSQINLVLTPEQRTKLEKIRTERRSKQQIQIATLRLRHRAQVRNILDQTMTKIQSILTSDQQRKMEPILNNNSCSD
jgi:DNA-binding MarR family transcriptional regulator